MTQGSLADSATLGFGTESRWDSGRGIYAASTCDVPGRRNESDAVCNWDGEAA